MRKARDEPATYWVADLNNYNGNSARLTEHRRCHRGAVGQDHVGSGVHALFCELGYCLRVRPRPTMLEPDVSAFRPPELQKFLAQRRVPNRYTKQNWPSQSRRALSAIMSNTGWTSVVERLMTLSTSAVAICCSRASFRSRVSPTTSGSWPETEELLWRTAFRVLALRLRALASLLLVLERRRIAYPQAKDYADFQSGITAGICDRRNGV